MGKVADETARPMGLAWLVVFLANLPIPLMFAWDLTAKHGRIGIAAAIVLWWLIGREICRVSRGLGLALVVGGVLVGLSQFLPLLHMLAGMASLDVGGLLGLVANGHYGPQEVTELGGFLVTLLTGGMLMTTALAGGALVRGIFLFLTLGRPDTKPGWDGEG